MTNALAVATEAVESSNMPKREKSAMLRFLEGKMSPRFSAGLGRAKAHVGAGGTALMSAAVSGLTGAGLGYAHGTLKEGLDLPMGSQHVPLDGLVAAVGLGGFVLMPSEDFSSTLCRAGATAFGVLGFRKTHDWAEKRAQRSGTAGAGTSTAAVHGEDPVRAVGEMLGLKRR
jgi:hypothetical protein